MKMRMKEENCNSPVVINSDLSNIPVIPGYVTRNVSQIVNNKTNESLMYDKCGRLLYPSNQNNSFLMTTQNYKI